MKRTTQTSNLSFRTRPFCFWNRELEPQALVGSNHLNERSPKLLRFIGSSWFSSFRNGEMVCPQAKSHYRSKMARSVQSFENLLEKPKVNKKGASRTVISLSPLVNSPRSSGHELSIDVQLDYQQLPEERFNRRDGDAAMWNIGQKLSDLRTISPQKMWFNMI